MLCLAHGLWVGIKANKRQAMAITRLNRLKAKAYVVMLCYLCVTVWVYYSIHCGTSQLGYVIILGIKKPSAWARLSRAISYRL